MGTSKKISAAQLYYTLFLCRIIALFTYIMPMKNEIATGDRFILFVPFLTFGILFSIPVFLITGKDANRGILDRASDFSPVTAKILAVLYLLGFIWSAGISTARFELFMSSVIFPDTDVTVYIILLLIASVLAATRGIEGIGRSSAIVLVLLVLSIIFVVATIIKEFDANNLTPPLESGIKALLLNSFFSSTRTIEIVAILILAPCTGKNLRKGFYIWIVAFSLVAGILFMIISGVTGNFGDLQMFQLYALTTLARFSIFERVDDLLTGIWVLCEFIKIALFISVSVKCIEQGFGKKNVRIMYPLSAAGIFAVYFAVSRTIAVFSETVKSTANEIIYVVFAAVIPLAVYFISKATEHKHRKNKKEIAA